VPGGGKYLFYNTPVAYIGESKYIHNILYDIAKSIGTQSLQAVIVTKIYSLRRTID
jgi:hypothetical protein